MIHDIITNLFGLLSNTPGAPQPTAVTASESLLPPRRGQPVRLDLYPPLGDFYRCQCHATPLRPLQEFDLLVHYNCTSIMFFLMRHVGVNEWRASWTLAAVEYDRVWPA
jgi:hypothetical protein